MTDLTPEELAAQEGAFDDPAADVPMLPPRVLAMDDIAFLRYEADFMPKASDDSYGKPATSYREDLSAWLDANREVDTDATRFMHHLVDIGPVGTFSSVYSMTAIAYQQAIQAWLDKYGS